MSLLAASLFGSAIVGSAQAAAQFGQASPHTLELNRVFYFNGDKAAYAKLPDCKAWPEAMQAFDTMRAAGKAITTVKGKDMAASFVGHAYAERLQPVQYVDLESVFIEPLGEDRYRVYTGNEPKQVVCGFDQPQFLDKLWLDAGLEGKAVSAPDADGPAESPLLSGLQAAFFGQKYPIVRNSLQQRGYSAFPVPDPVTKRCEPTLERLCQAFPEALCDQGGISGIGCTFVFRREGTRQLIGVDAAVFDLTQYTADIEVVKLRELGNGP